MDAYDEGKNACEKDEHSDGNPHTKGTQERIDWFNGFFDMKHEKMFPTLKLEPVGRGKSLCQNG